MFRSIISLFAIFLTASTPLMATHPLDATEQRESAAKSLMKFFNYMHGTPDGNTKSVAQCKPTANDFRTTFATSDLEAIASYASGVYNGTVSFDAFDPAFLKCDEIYTFMEGIHNHQYDVNPILREELRVLDQVAGLKNTRLHRSLNQLDAFEILKERKDVSEDMLFQVVSALETHYMWATRKATQALPDNYDPGQIDQYKRDRYIKVIMYHYVLRFQAYQILRADQTYQDMPDKTFENLLDRIEYLVLKEADFQEDPLKRLMIRTAIQGNASALIHNETKLSKQEGPQKLSRQQQRALDRKGKNVKAPGVPSAPQLKTRPAKISRLAQGMDRIERMKGATTSKSLKQHLQNEYNLVVMRGLMDTSVPKSFSYAIGSQEPVEEPKAKLAEVLLMGRVLNSTLHANPALASEYTHFKKYFICELLNLMNRLDDSEMAFMKASDRISLLQAGCHVMAQSDSRDFLGGTDTDSPKNRIIRLIFDKAAHTVDKETHAEMDEDQLLPFAKEALKALPTLSAGQNLWAFYEASLQTELEESLTQHRRQQKRVGGERQRQINIVTNRVRVHLQILEANGQVDTAVELLQDCLKKKKQTPSKPTAGQKPSERDTVISKMLVDVKKRREARAEAERQRAEKAAEVERRRLEFERLQAEHPQDYPMEGPSSQFSATKEAKKAAARALAKKERKQGIKEARKYK